MVVCKQPIPSVVVISYGTYINLYIIVYIYIYVYIDMKTKAVDLRRQAKYSRHISTSPQLWSSALSARKEDTNNSVLG